MNKKKLIKEVVKEELPYRKSISMPKDIGFGYEIELGTNNPRVKRAFEREFSEEDFEVQHEYTLNANYGLELSTPVLHNTREDWIKLKKLSEKFKKFKGIFTDGSFQVNLDDEKDVYLKPYEFLKLFTAYEDIIYRISRGSDEKLRDTIFHYAGSCKRELLKKGPEFNEWDLQMKLYRNKFYVVSLKHRIIEFRTPNSTFDAWFWQNYTNVFYNLLTVKNSKIDKEKVDEYFNEDLKYELDIDKAVEFANLIFKSDIDKLYFMKQYLYGMDKEKILELV